MRIDPKIPASQNAEINRADEVQSATGKGTKTASASQPTDTVQLSSGQATIRQLVSKLDQIPDVRQEQVNALRAEVHTGKFQRGNDQVAGAIVSHLLGI